MVAAVRKSGTGAGMNNLNNWMNQNDRWFLFAGIAIALMPLAWMLVGGWR
jgi:hypothetical protein